MSTATTDAADDLSDVVASMDSRLPRAEIGEWDTGLWDELERAGLSRVGLPEHLGGHGGGLADAAAVVGQLARAGRATPAAELCMIAAPVAARAGLALPPGIVTVAPSRSVNTLDVRRQGSDYQLSGTLAGVSWGADAQWVLVSFTLEDCCHLAVVTVEEQRNGRRRLNAQPVADLSFDAVAVPAEHVVAWPDEVAGSPLYRYGALARATQMLGTLQWALELSSTHVTTREQFGRPLARFQAVQHLMAEFGSEVLVAQAAVAAAVAADEETDFEEAVAVAKICTGHAVAIGSHAAHQVHAAIGFTDEYPLSSLTRNLWAWRDDFGSESYWSRWFLDRVVDAGTGEVWPNLCAVGTSG